MLLRKNISLLWLCVALLFANAASAVMPCDCAPEHHAIARASLDDAAAPPCHKAEEHQQTSQTDAMECSHCPCWHAVTMVQPLVMPSLGVESPAFELVDHTAQHVKTHLPESISPPPKLFS